MSSSHSSKPSESKKPPLFEKDGLRISLHSETNFSNTSIAILLKESKSKSFYLTKVAVTLMFFLIPVVIANCLILFDTVRARIWNRALNLKIMTWVALTLSILIKLLGGFGNRFVSKIQPLLYVLDLVFFSLFYFGLYWHLESAYRDSYQYFGKYLIICGFLAFAMSLGFLFSTLVRTPREIYSVTAGLILIPIFTASTLVLCRFAWHTLLLRPHEYVVIFLLSLIDTIYLVLEARFFLTLRISKIYDHEYIHSFFRLFTDFFFYFWKDLFLYFKKMRKDAKKKDKKKKKKLKQKKKAKKLRKELEDEMKA